MTSGTALRTTQPKQQTKGAKEQVECLTLDTPILFLIKTQINHKDKTEMVKVVKMMAEKSTEKHLLESGPSPFFGATVTGQGGVWSRAGREGPESASLVAPVPLAIKALAWKRGIQLKRLEYYFIQKGYFSLNCRSFLKLQNQKSKIQTKVIKSKMRHCSRVISNPKPITKNNLPFFCHT